MDVQYFIDKFGAIPEEQWTTECYQDNQNRRCALGHCSPNVMSKYKDERVESFVEIAESQEEEGRVLLQLFWDHELCVPPVNDGYEIRYTQGTPKQRILAALRDIQKKEQMKTASIIPLCSECGKPITECDCEEEIDEEEDWGAGAAEEVDHIVLEVI